MDDKNRNFANECDNSILNQPQNGTVLALKDLGEQTADEINCYINGQKRFVEFTKKEKEILLWNTFAIFAVGNTTRQ